MVVRIGTGRVAKTYVGQVEQKQSVYLANYGIDYTGITIAPHVRDDKGGATARSTLSHSRSMRTDEERFEDMVHMRRRRIMDLGLSNKFELFGILTWRTKKMRFDTKAQDEQVRQFFSKLHRKYPDVRYMAVRHKNPNGTGYHVHVLIGGLPRHRIRIKKNQYDSENRQTYCLLGWSKRGWASVTYIENQRRVVDYISKTARMSQIPKNVRALVTYSKNLKRPVRTKANLDTTEILELKHKSNQSLIYKTSFDVGSNGHKQKMHYRLCKGEINAPHTEQKGASNE